MLVSCYSIRLKYWSGDHGSVTLPSPSTLMCSQDLCVSCDMQWVECKAASIHAVKIDGIDSQKRWLHTYVLESCVLCHWLARLCNNKSLVRKLCICLYIQISRYGYLQYEVSQRCKTGPGQYTQSFNQILDTKILLNCCRWSAWWGSMPWKWVWFQSRNGPFWGGRQHFLRAHHLVVLESLCPPTPQSPGWS